MNTKDSSAPPFPLPHGGFSIGGLALAHPTVLAPLAGVTDLPFRLMVRGFGCGLVCSEMVSADGLVYGSEKTFRLMASKAAESPLSIQIFGSDPAIMAEAAVRVQEAGADILDINCGCSVRKVLKSGSGSALMQEPRKTEEILKKVRNVLSIPLTLKMRSGWTADGKDAEILSRIAEDCGVDALTLHPRTARQGFGGKAEISHIRRIKALVKIPVIGNGDITSPEEALKMFEATGCDAVMVGRASLYSPHILRDIHRMLGGLPPLGRENRSHFSAMRGYVKDMVHFYGEDTACRLLRSRLGWLAKGLFGSTAFRSQTASLASWEEALQRIADIEALQPLENRTCLPGYGQGMSHESPIFQRE